jgi:membrane fusion protein (multidrug efflux system)
MSRPVEFPTNPAEEPETENMPAPESAPRGKSRIGMILLAVLLLGGAVGVGAWLHYRDQVSSDDAEVEGRITAISPRISGNVLEVLVDDNQHVEAGQVLVRIDPRDYQARVDQARAAVAQAEGQLNSARTVVPLTNETTQSGTTAAAAQLANVQAELEHARLTAQQAGSSDLAFAEATVRAREANNDRAQADLARMKPLADKAEISRQQFDSYVAAARVAASDLQAAREKLASARDEAAIRRSSETSARSRVEQARAQLANSEANRKQVDVRRADVGTAAASVEAARASLAAAELLLSYATITAPVRGVVTRKSVEAGQMVQPGQSLMAVVPLDDTWITANFKETQLAGVHPGQRAEIHVDMYGKVIPGRVESIAGATGARMSLLPPENATGNFVKVVQRIPVKILVDKREGLVLRPGMNVNVTIFTK